MRGVQVCEMLPTTMDNPWAILLCTVSSLFVLGRLLRRQKLPYPPGPKGLPIIGNIYDFPPKSEWIQYAKWSQELGSDVIHMNFAGMHMLIVNSHEAATELFEKRSAIWSDRPRMPMVMELMGWDWAFSFFSSSDPRWRRHRKLAHRFFNINAVAEFEPRQVKATHEFLKRLLDEPEQFTEHIRLMAGGLILDVSYGIDVQSMQDPFLVIVERTMEALSEAGKPGKFLVDMLPILKYVPSWLPGAGFKRKAKEWKKSIQAAAIVPYEYAKDQMLKGHFRKSLVSMSFDDFPGGVDAQSEDIIRGVSAAMYTAGSDTTVATLGMLFLVMNLYPEIMRKAQNELDQVLGDRLPEFSDRDSLPYVCALVHEVTRWNPVAPLAVPRRLIADDVYEGMFMPGGSIVLANTWAMFHDERVYEDPFAFKPERFLKDGQPDPEVKTPEAAFGFGRRICPGRYLASNTVFLMIASILAVFNIEKAVDENGNVITPSEDYTSGPISRPVPYKCSIKPRSPETSRLISEAYSLYHPSP